MKKYKYFIFLVALSFIFYNCKHEIIKQEPSITTVTQSGSCSPDSVYFNKDVMPIIQANCAVSGCHGGGAAQDGVDLSSYDKIINTGGVKPFDANDSDLYEAITETNSDD
ncbi:MAG: hypothetical protein R3279_10930, partial [Putridiphycobacter sp.]|nr:hypothetical protein [Putridiphycobacter sp.]